MSVPVILHVIPTLDVGGAETMLCKLLETWPRAAQHRVLPLLRTGHLATRISAAGAVIEDTTAYGPLSLYSHVRRTIRRVQPDAVVGWMYHANLLAALAGARGQAPLIWNVRHALHALSGEKWTTRWAIRANALLSSRATAILYNTEIAAAQHEKAGFRNEARHVVPNGFDCETFAPDDRARARLFRLLEREEDGSVLIGLVARAHPVKNHVGFIRAIGDAVRSGAPVLGVMIGRGVPERQAEFEDLAARRGASGSVFCLREQHNIPKLLPGFDIVALPSLSEGFPNVIGEAMACGVPCIGSDVSDMRRIIGETGRIVPPGDDGALGRALAELALMAPTERRRLGWQARARIVGAYALDHIAERYVSIVHEMLARAT